MNNEPTIEQMNYAIARFIGITPIPAGAKRLGDIKPPEESIVFLNYHERWDLIMPVYHLVREKAFELHGNPDAQRLYADITNQLLFGIIADVHLKVFQFITWLNQQTTTNG